VTLATLLADAKFALTADAAIGELLALWGAPYDAARGEPCVQAQQYGLRCQFQRRGTLGGARAEPDARDAAAYQRTPGPEIGFAHRIHGPGSL
jgi:hypothetical protein